ncbi:hypothetical protein L9F63_004682, partial [Diploptera punctata]
MSNREGCNYQEKLLVDTFKLNTNLLKLCGLVPSHEISDVPWKYKLYRAYTCFNVFIIFSGLITTFLATLEHWDNIERAGENAIECISFSLVFIGSVYILLYWDKLQILMRSTDHEFSSNIQKTYVKHLHESKCISKSLTSFLLVACLSITIGRGYLPLIIHYVRKYLLDSEEINTHGLNLVFDMWLPFHIDKTKSFLSAYIIQVFVQSICVIHHVSVITYFFALFLYSCARFQVLLSALEDINSFIPILPESDQKSEKLYLQNEDVGEFIESQYIQTNASTIKSQMYNTATVQAIECVKCSNESPGNSSLTTIKSEDSKDYSKSVNNMEHFQDTPTEIYRSTSNDDSEGEKTNIPKVIMLNTLYTQEDRDEARINKLNACALDSLTDECIGPEYQFFSETSSNTESQSAQCDIQQENGNKNSQNTKLPNLIMLKKFTQIVLG